jgi:hypothetical protein
MSIGFEDSALRTRHPGGRDRVHVKRAGTALVAQPGSDDRAKAHALGALAHGVMSTIARQ